MKRYRQGRGRVALDVPDLPTKEQYDIAYAAHWQTRLYPSRRFGDIHRDDMWKQAEILHQSKILKDRQWIASFLNGLGFEQ